MAICCGKIDKSMRAGKIKSFGYFVLFMGLLTVSAAITAIWSIFRNEIKSVPKILFSFWLVFLSESARLTLIPADKKARAAGRIFRFSPRLSGYFYKYFDSLLVFFMLCILSAGAYGVLTLF